METVVALLMFINFEIKEHRIQPSMGVCLRGKREAERVYSDTVLINVSRLKLKSRLITMAQNQSKKSYSSKRNPIAQILKHFTPKRFKDKKKYERKRYVWKRDEFKS